MSFLLSPEAWKRFALNTYTLVLVNESALGVGEGGAKRGSLTRASLAVRQGGARTQFP